MKKPPMAECSPVHPDLALVGCVVSLLFAHGQTTEGTRVAAERVSEGLGRQLTLAARWGELTLSEGRATTDLRMMVTPLAIDMGVVAAVEEIVERVRTGQMGCTEALATLVTVERRPPVGLARFATMTGLGAAALSVVFGAGDAATVALVASSAGAGGLLRRALSRVSDDPFLQPFGAALLAGGIAAAALALRLPVAPSLVAVCPCMVLVPGPHFLNGMLDLARARIPLGAARLVFALLVVAAISAGLLAGLSPAAAGLPEGGPAPAVPLLRDVAAAGLAVAAYGSFFNMPWRALPVPIAVGMVAHALRWALLARGAGAGEATFAACLLVGAVMTPAAHRLRLPLGALAFASVVSMIPGALMFRAASEALALVGGAPASLETVTGLLGALATAALILLAMAAGLVVPKMMFDRWPKSPVRAAAA